MSDIGRGLTGLPDLSLDQRRERLLQRLRRDAAWIRWLGNEFDLIGLLLRDHSIPVEEAEAWHAELWGAPDTAAGEEGSAP